MVPSNFEENKVAFERPWEYAEANAIGKAEEVAKRMLVALLLTACMIIYITITMVTIGTGRLGSGGRS